MTDILSEYEKLVKTYGTDPLVVAGQMFGKACLKLNGKAFLAQHKDAIVFKLSGASHGKAIALPGALLWDPSGKGRPMKEWVALPSSARPSFAALASAAYDYIANGA